MIGKDVGSLGDVLIMRSMNILRAQLERIKVREAMHLPPGMILPDALTVSRAGLAQA
jgi:hypothetical protein